MSRSITIPEYKNPFVVTINNTVYEYKGGETVEVPDEVAEAIEDALDEIPKPKRYLSKFAQFANGTLPEITASDLEGIETIVYYAFGHCYSLTSVEIPDSVKSLGEYAFSGCSHIKSVRFGKNSKLSSIGIKAFSWCSSLEDFHLPVTPPTLADINVFESTNKKCVFYCKTQASLDAYKVAPIWSTLAGTYSFAVEE